MPCRAASPERGWTKPAWPSGIATARPVPTSARSPGPSSTLSLAERSRPASPSYALVGSVASSWRRVTGKSVMHPSGDVSVLPRRSGTARSGAARGDPRSKLVQALAGERGDLQRVRVAVREPAPAECVHGVDLVDHELDRQLVRADLAQDAVHGCDLLDEELLGSRPVDDVKDDVGHERLLERCRKPFHQLMRQAADEADGVGDEVAAPFVLEAARGWVERLEQAVAHRDAGVGERIEERGLARIRVAGERHRRSLGAPPLLAPDVALAAQLAQPLAEKRDAAARQAPVRLELRLARAAGADSAAETLEVLPHPPHPREVVLELRKLDLELSLGADGVLGEDVEDQLRAVDDPRLERVLERPLLGRAQLVVDDQDLCLGVPVRLL